jgi:hypothetical protein
MASTAILKEIRQVPARFDVDKTLVGMIILLGLLFPMFGGSLV